MSNIEIRNNLTAPHAGKESPLYILISGKTRLPEQRSYPSTDLSALWAAEWWGFHCSSVFQKLRPDVQQRILCACNQAMLNEAYFIEKSGLAYTAKMVLMAESTDMAQLYALIGADEARHLAWIEPYIKSEQKTCPSGQFLMFLSTLVEDVPPRLLVYLVQIILEGWGLDHYMRLSTSCQQDLLSYIFSNILKDEALHHRSGQLLFDHTTLLPTDFPLIKDSLQCYAEMVRIGPQATVAAMDQATGGLSFQDVEEIIIALRHSEETARKLTLLKDLMRQPGVESVVDELDEMGYFVPMSPTEAARAYIAHR